MTELRKCNKEVQDKLRQRQSESSKIVTSKVKDLKDPTTRKGQAELIKRNKKMHHVVKCPLCKKEEMRQILIACSKCGIRVCEKCRIKGDSPICKDCNKEKPKTKSLDSFFK